MKAAVVPAVSSSWQIKDVPQPQPGPGQVLVKMHASGICYTDVHQTLGHLPGQFPRILGHEPVGEVVAVAPDVTTRKDGDRVGSPWIYTRRGRGATPQEGRGGECQARPRRAPAEDPQRSLPASREGFVRASRTDLLRRVYRL